MGSVHLARDEHMGGREVAIKILEAGAFDPEAIDRFKNEFRSMARLRHPNLAEVYDFGVLDDNRRHYLSLEYIEGKDLSAYRWPASRDVIDDLIVQCLRALDYIHTRGLLHNDIKPQNILVREPLQVKILDFGLAHPQADPARPAPGGTIQYISPERLRGQRPDPRSDLYSLGVVLYEILTGHLPFRGDDPGTVIGAALRGKFTRPRMLNPDIPERVERLLLGLLSADPLARPATASAALRLLGDGGGSSPLTLDTPETVASYVSSGQFIGREKELNGLVQAAARHVADPARDDEPRLHLIAGESGIGKSRLLREVKHRLQLTGIPTLAARCFEEAGFPFHAFVEFLRPLARRPDLQPEDRAVLEAVIPESAGGDRADAGFGVEKKTLLGRLARLLDQAGDGRPGVILIEDLHWCDGPGLDLLDLLVRRPARGRWLAIGTTREALPFERRARGRRIRRIDLAPLDEETVAQLLDSMVPFEERPRDLARVLVEQTEGNPLYVEELVRSLAEEGVLKRGERAWVAENAASEAVRLAPGLANVLERRLDALSSEGRRILDMRAVFNRPVPVDLIARVLGASGRGLDADLLPLGQRHLVLMETDRAGATLVDLAHSRMREAIYRRLTDEGRRSLHRAAGDGLAAAHGDSLDAVAEELAHHYRAAGEDERAVEFSVRAARRAKQLFFPERQARLLGWALESLPAEDTRRRADVRRDLIEVLAMGLGEFEEAIRQARTLQDEARRLEDAVQEARANRYESWSRSFFEGPGAALEPALRALSLARATADQVEIALALNNLGVILARQGRSREAIASLTEARGILEPIGHSLVETLINNESLCHLALGDIAAARELAERAIEQARESRGEYDYHQNICTRAIVQSAAGELKAARATLEETISWLRDHSILDTLIRSLSLLADVCLRMGAYDRADRALQEHRDLVQSTGDIQEECMGLDFIGEMHRALGHFRRAETAHRDGLRAAREANDRTQEGFLLCALALDLQEANDPAAAVLAREAAALGREIRNPRISARALGVLALDAARRGDRRAAASFTRQLARHDRRRLRYEEGLRVNLVLGRCALLGGKPQEAEREARAGLEASEATGFREYAWRFRALLGQSLEARGLYGEARDAYNSAYTIIRAVEAEIEDPSMAEDYRNESARRDVARRVAGASPDAPGAGGPPVRRAPADAGLTAERLATIYEISQAINSILVLEELLNKVMDLAIEIVRAERGLIFLVRGEANEMEPVVARNMEGVTIEDATEYSRSILKEAGRGRAILSHDAAVDSRFKEFRSVSKYQIHSLLCAPLTCRNRVIGTVYVDTRVPGVVFNEDDLQFLQAFANQAAIAIENARLYEQVRQENRYLRQAVQERYGYENIVGRSAKMKELFEMLARVSPSNLPVVIQGESGTGKELIARAIHQNSTRRDHRFFTENCAALPDTLLESELFGHVKGAFTGADSARKGLFEMADGGTLFLDEVGDMSVSLQSKLLRVLQDGEIRPVGSETTRRVDVRVISATNRNLEDLIKEKKFREDLYFRLNVIRLRLPPLRERKSDIPLLADHFLARVAKENGTEKLRIEPGLVALMSRYDWPGNVRELENAMYRLALFAGGNTLTLDDAKQDADFYRKATASAARDIDTGKPSRVEIEKALEQADGNREQAARILGISRATMFRRLKSLDLPKGTSRGRRAPGPRSD